MHRIADAKLTTSTFNLYSPYFGDFEWANFLGGGSS